jgi:histidine triad (HIT) family protein
MNEDCKFCKIIQGKSEADIVYQDDAATAFWDIHPKAPVHILIVPNRHIASVNDMQPDDETLMGHLFWVAKEVARQQNTQKGYRLMVNTGPASGQVVFHLHIHLLGRRP